MYITNKKILKAIKYKPSVFIKHVLIKLIEEITNNSLLLFPESHSIRYNIPIVYGYLYFYQLRYYLAPCESIHYNSYAYIINYESYQEIYNYLSKLDVDYFIIRDNPILSNELNIKFDQINGSVFKKNKKSTNIHDLLIREE